MSAVTPSRDGEACPVDRALMRLRVAGCTLTNAVHGEVKLALQDRGPGGLAAIVGSAIERAAKVGRTPNARDLRAAGGETDRSAAPARAAAVAVRVHARLNPPLRFVRVGRLHHPLLPQGGAVRLSPGRDNLMSSDTAN